MQPASHPHTGLGHMSESCLTPSASSGHRIPLGAHTVTSSLHCQHTGLGVGKSVRG